MLTILNLFVIDKIFAEYGQGKLSAMAKMCYINCLTHYFKDKSATVSNATQFELSEADFKNFSKFKPLLQELHNMEIITIGQKTIVFNNVWGQFINRDLLTKVTPHEYVGAFSFHPVTKFKDELYNSRHLVELSMMKYKLSQDQVNKLIDLFIKEQLTFEKTYSNFSECIKHCSFWMASNTDKFPKDNVKSSGKIIGYN